MAAFLRKKTREGPSSPPPPLPAVPPPLFARFATSNAVPQPSPRIVSSPKVLSRKDPKKRSTPSAKSLPPQPSPPPSTADPSGSTLSLSPGNRQSRPPPSAFKNQPLDFSSAHTLNTPTASRRTSNSLTSPPKRNHPPPPPPLSNPQILPPIANKKIIQQQPPITAFGRQNLLSPPTTAQSQTTQQQQQQPSSLANQDLHPANSDISMSMIGASQDSDRSPEVDLPPEFAALFHNFNQQFDLEDRNSSSAKAVQSINSNNDHVPASNVPRSPDRRPSISTPSPLPPPKSDMGVASSLPSSSSKDFYSPRKTSTYKPAANQPQMRRHSPPPLPPQTPSSSSPPPPPLPKQDVKSSLPRSEEPSMHKLHKNSGSPSPRKSIIHSQQGSPMAGKPRIFSMTAQVDELDRASGTILPPSPYSAAKKPSTMHVVQQQQPSASEWNTSTNGSDSVKPVFSSSVQPPFKSPPNHHHHHVEQQQQLPPTPPSVHRGGSRSDNVQQRPQSQFDSQNVLQPGSSRSRRNSKSEEEAPTRPLSSQHVQPQSSRRKDSKSDEQPRPVSQLVQPQSSHSRKDSKSDEPQRPVSQHVQPQSSHSRKDSKSDEQPRPVSQHVQPQSSHSRKDSKSDEPQRPLSQHIPRTPSRTRKLSKPRPAADVISVYGSINGDIVLPGTPDSHHHHRRTSSIQTLTKSHSTTPAANAAPHKPLFDSPKPDGDNTAPLEPAIELDEDTKSKAGIVLDDDPFARVEGVAMLRPLSSFGGEKEDDDNKDRESVVSGRSNEKKYGHRKSFSSIKGPSVSSLNGISSHVGLEDEEEKSPSTPPVVVVVEGVAPPTPVSPEEQHRTTTTTKKKKKKKKRHDDDGQTESTLAPMLETEVTSSVPVTSTEEQQPESLPELDLELELDPEPEPEPILLPTCTIIDFLSDPQLLSSLLSFFTFYDWCLLSSLSKEIRILLVQSPVLRETVLERFLKTVGYSRWIWDDPDPLLLSLQDLNDYMRGVSTPTHEYARVAGMYVHSLTVHPNHRDPTLIDVVRILTASTRAYTRVILRLRAQAEKEAILVQQSRGLGITIKQPNNNNNNYYPLSSSSSSVRGGGGGGGNYSRVSSRAPSPTTSNGAGSSNGLTTSMQEQNSTTTSLTFRSPLFRLRRAPLLRVFVPSPEGDWLSDKSVLACEEECKRAGVMHLIRLGDVIWDVAVGDEGNVGRLVWDGSYLIDLDYSYTSIGDLPKYLPTLAFPPSYFHRVIRTGPIISNPIVHIDISPWGEEIAMNLQLLQDRVRTETPQGAYHNVVRWVHRSSFVIRPGPARFTTTTTTASQQGGVGGGVGKTQMLISRIPIPDTDNTLFVDSGWHGTVVVETEGTNEALADLQERCGPGVFPPRYRGVSQHTQTQAQINRIQIENKKVFRILREKSRPGEIWIKTVGIKERIM